MKIAFEIEAFAEAAKAIRVVPNAAIGIEVMSHARLAVASSELTLTMSDLDREAHATIPCEGGGNLVVAIPPAVLEFFAGRAGSEDQGSLEFDEGLRNVTARHARARLTMPILPGDQFPVFAQDDATWSLRIRAHALLSLFKVCRKAVSDMDPSRPTLEGLSLKLTPAGELAAAGLDGKRIHVIAIDAPPIEGAMPGIILPASSVDKLAAIFAGDESEIVVSGNANRVQAAGERIRFATKLMAGDYLDYDKFIPDPGGFRVTASAKALDAAIGRLLVIPKTDNKGKREATRAVRMTPRDGALLLEMKGNDGDIEDVVPATIEGDGRPMAFNHKYVRELIEAVGEGDITFAPTAENDACVRVLAQREGTRFILFQRHF